MSSRSCFMQYLIIVIIFSITLVTCSAALSLTENDRIALLALKDGFTHGATPPENSHLNSWNSSLHICDWKGVMCDVRRKSVTEIHMGKQKLSGIISPSIGNLSSLIHLTLNNNSLHGEIPKQIGKLHRLQFLGLHFNSLQGQIPVELSNCSNLLKLDLHMNELSGTIPYQLGSLTKITHIYVEQNQLVGELPTFWRNISSLTELYIRSNNLHGEIRNSFQGLSKLTSLSLADNNFAGAISPLYNLSSLNNLELSYNKFTGMLPQDIDVAFPKLTAISLAYNRFTGVLPLALCNISSLSFIQLNYNMLVGPVPNNIGNLKNLWVLFLQGNNMGGSTGDLRFISSLTNCTKLIHLGLSNNSFAGPIPNTIGNLSSNLQTLRMSGNSITGHVPEEIGELSGLSLIHLYDNALMGTIPNSIGGLSNLAELYLFQNKLGGDIPPSIGKLTNLLKLDLSTNLLRGIIPQTFGNCTSLQTIDVSSNHLDGYVPSNVFGRSGNLYYCNLSRNSFSGRLLLQLANMRTLNILDVSYNNFTGEIPAQLGESLEFLSMAGNSFLGSIPESLGSFRGLKWLDLSSNMLSGPVIKEFTSMFLQNLNLSFNQLQGGVPIFKNVTGVSVVGNNKLCGGNPELHLRPCHLEMTKKKSISLKVVIAATVSTFALLSTFVLIVIFFHRQRVHKKENEDGLHERYRRISYVELFKATSGFAESNLIGTGSFGEVFKGNLDGDESKPVVVKVLKLSKSGATKSFAAECKILKSIRHRNLLKIITSCSSSDHKGNDFKALVLQYMSNGNLDTWVHHQEARSPLSLTKRIEIAIDVGCALDYLHNYSETPIVHCDLKPSNILLDEDMVAHVGDFGLAKLTENLSGGESLSAAIKGTVGYVAPEYGMGARISPKGDVYSYGILLLELITGIRPTNEMFNNEMNLRSFIERAIPDHTEEVIDECLVNELYEAMAAIQTDPEQYKLQWHSCIVSFAEVGLSCSAESAKDRMDIESAIKCLMRIKEKVCQI